MPTLVLLPGLHGTHDLFEPLLKLIPATFPSRVIAYPLDRMADNDAIYRHVESELAGERELVLLGESFSGPVALRFAATHPDRVTGVILCCSFVTRPVPSVLCYLATLPILCRIPIPALAIRMFLAGSRAPDTLVHKVRRVIRSVNPIVLAHRVRQAAQVNAVEYLRRCDAPILYLAGTRDRLVGKRALRHISRLRADIQIFRLDAPHLLLQRAPDEAWSDISRFLARL